MPTRNCETRLIKPGDSNVMVSVFSINPRSYTIEKAYHSAWLQKIEKAIGSYITCSSKTYCFYAKQLGHSGIHVIQVTGRELIQKIGNEFDTPVSFRLDIEDSWQSWIFYLEKDI